MTLRVGTRTTGVACAKTIAMRTTKTGASGGSAGSNRLNAALAPPCCAAGVADVVPCFALLSTAVSRRLSEFWAAPRRHASGRRPRDLH